MSDPSLQLPTSAKFILKMLETKNESATWRINIQKNGPYFEETCSLAFINAFQHSSVTRVSFHCYNDVLESNKNIDALIEAIVKSGNVSILEWFDTRILSDVFDSNRLAGQNTILHCLLSAFIRHGNKSITSVNLHNAAFDFRLLAAFSHCCSNLLHLSLERCIFLGGADNIMDFGGIDKLNSLVLDSVSDEHLSMILKHIGGCSKSLTLRRCNLRLPAATELKTLLLNSKGLRHLCLTWIQFHEDNFSAIYEGLQKSRTVEKVSFDHCHFDETSTTQFENLFSSTQSLNCLFVRYRNLHFSNRSRAEVLSTVLHSKCLREFAIDDQERLDYIGVREVCRALKVNSSLRVLKIGRIDDGFWLSMISTAIARNKGLQEFHARFSRNHHVTPKKSDFLEAAGKNLSLRVIQNYDQVFFCDSEKAQLARIVTRNTDAAKLLSASETDDEILRKLPEVYHCLLQETNCGPASVLRSLLGHGEALGFCEK